jgi:hypothetical protein
MAGRRSCSRATSDFLASNFRFSTEDVDVARIEQPWPEWLVEVASIAAERNWSEHWLNDAVTFHLSQLADEAGDHVEFGTFPRDHSPPGLIVHVPTAPYMLAEAESDPSKRTKTGPQEGLNLMSVLGLQHVGRCDCRPEMLFSAERRESRQVAVRSEVPRVAEGSSGYAPLPYPRP